MFGLISQREHDRLLLAEQCRRSLSKFVQEMWEVTDEGNPLVWNWHMDAICTHLQALSDGRFHKLVICIPPGFAKSKLVSVMWQAWDWLREPSKRYLLGSYDENLTFRDSDACRELIQSEKYQRLFNPDWSISRSQNSKNFFRSSRGGYRKTYFMGSRYKTGWRGSVVAVDDPLSAEDRYDKIVKQAVINTWDKVMSTRVNDISTATFLVIMQRLADDDLVGHIMRSEYADDYVYLILPNEYDPSRHCTTPIFSDPRTIPGELLFPQKFPAEECRKLRIKLGEVDYEAQYQHNPFPEAGSRFDSKHFLYWKYAPISNCIHLHRRNGTVEVCRVDLMPKFMVADIACSEKRTADYTVIGLFARTPSGEMILLYANRIQAREGVVVDTIGDIFAMQEFGRIRPQWVGIESNGVGLPIIQNTQSRNIPVLPIHVSSDKVTMSATAIIRFHSGQIYIPDPSIAPWVSDFMRELVAFPGGSNDDYVSMISLAANSIFEATITTFGNSPPVSVSIPHRKHLTMDFDPSKRKRFGYQGATK